MKKRYGAFLVFLSFMANVSAHAQTWPSATSSGSPCAATTVTLCDGTYTLPASNIGNMESVTMPQEYADNEIDFRCEGDKSGSHYELLNPTALDCVIRSCKPGNVYLCGLTIPVDAKVNVGETVTVEVPGEMVSKQMASSVILTAQCIRHRNLTSYEAVVSKDFSCAMLAPPAPATP